MYHIHIFNRTQTLESRTFLWRQMNWTVGSQNSGKAVVNKGTVHTCNLDLGKMSERDKRTHQIKNTYRNSPNETMQHQTMQEKEK